MPLRGYSTATMRVNLDLALGEHEIADLLDGRIDGPHAGQRDSPAARKRLPKKPPIPAAMNLPSRYNSSTNTARKKGMA